MSTIAHISLSLKMVPSFFSFPLPSPFRLNTIIFLSGNDGVLHEVWLNRRQLQFSLKNVTDGYPSHLEVLHNFSQSNVSHGNFGQTFRTFLLAKQTGSFIFKLSCSFQCDLWVSPNDELDDKVMLLSIDEEGNSYGSGVRYGSLLYKSCLQS